MKRKLLIIFVLLFVWFEDSSASMKNKDIECLALNVYHEARGESIKGQEAVAIVTMNRVFSGNYPNSVCAVVFQKAQFSWTEDKIGDKPTDIKAWRLALQLSSYIYKEYREKYQSALVDFTGGATYYYAPKHAKPKWAKEKEITTVIGGHIFLREKIQGYST